jgi:hypothetical protein
MSEEGEKEEGRTKADRGEERRRRVGEVSLASVCVRACVCFAGGIH